MSEAVLQALSGRFGARVLETSGFRGDEVAVVAPADWVEVATFLRDDPGTAMDHFVDLTAVDRPERDPRFDVLLSLRSAAKRHRVRVATRVAEGQPVPTLTGVWLGAGWAEREIWDMFGVSFEGHGDLRRILTYEAFEGHPLRKDYPIERAQPLVPYREDADLSKLPPFGVDEGQPFARVDWPERLAGRSQQVSPALAEQQGQRRALSDGEAARQLDDALSEAQAASTEGRG